MANYYILRPVFPVDTSGLDDAATISAAKFYIKALGPDTIGDNDAQAYTALVQGTWASSSAPADVDYDQMGTTKGSDDYAHDSLPAGEAYFFYTLNATGLTWINKTGYTQLGIKEGHDIEDSAVAARNSMSCRMSETASDTSDPYLEVTYTVAAGPTNLKSLDTNVKANIKSYNTNPIANIKSINTNT